MTLQDFFLAHPRGAVAFSGGTDSALLVWAAAQYGADWRAYTVKTAFQPDFEWKDAQTLTRQVGLPLTVIEADLWNEQKIISNPPRRCYYCKRFLFSLLRAQAERDGYTLLIDGTNASDPESDRPGMQALRELSVRSPLRECGITKDEVRQLCRQAGLSVWDKPSYACLATRIPTGTAITPDQLLRVEQGEELLRSMGFRDVRIRLRRSGGLIQVTADQLPRMLREQSEILAVLSPLFEHLAVDTNPRIPND